MKTIKIIIETDKEITLNGEYTCVGPVEMSWFPRNNLVIEVAGKKLTLNTDTTEFGRVYRLPAGVFE